MNQMNKMNSFGLYLYKDKKIKIQIKIEIKIFRIFKESPFIIFYIEHNISKIFLKKKYIFKKKNFFKKEYIFRVPDTIIFSFRRSFARSLLPKYFY